MAQRRSRNRLSSQRKSTNNVSGFLNDNTTYVDNDDLLWSNRSALRPSTSLNFIKNASSVLSPDSTLNVSQLTDKWFNNLTQSNSSKLMENSRRKEANEESDSVADPTTESESEHESQKKRAKFKLNQTKGNKTDKSNVFLKALEKTTDSHTRNLTINPGIINESESTNDESRTIKRSRPQVFRMKNNKKDDQSNFDDIFHNSTLDKSRNSSRNLRSLKENSIHKSDHTLTEITTKNKATFESPKRINKSKDKTVMDSSIKRVEDESISKSQGKKLRSRILTENSLSSNKTLDSVSKTKSSRAKKRPGTDESFNTSNSVAENVQKKRRALFSSEQKDKYDSSKFDAVFDSDEQSNKNVENGSLQNKTQTNQDPAKTTGEINVEDNSGDSESSSIPKNIRRTRSRSIFKEKSEHHLNRTKEVQKEIVQSKSISYNSSESRNKSINNKSLKDSTKQASLDKSNEEASKVTTDTEQNKEDENSSRSKIRRKSKKVSQIEKSIDENTSDSSYVGNSSKYDEANKSLGRSRRQESVNRENLDETPKLSQRSSLKQDGYVSTENIVSNPIVSSTSIEYVNDKKSSDEDEGENSSMPKYIRRTKSRLFQKSKTTDEDNIVTNEMLDAENPNVLNEIEKSASRRKSVNQKVNDLPNSSVNSSKMRSHHTKSKNNSLARAPVNLTRMLDELSKDRSKKNLSINSNTKKSSDEQAVEKTVESIELSIGNESLRKSYESSDKESMGKSKSPSGESLDESEKASGTSDLIEKDRSVSKSKKAIGDSNNTSNVGYSAKADVPERNKESSANSVETSSDGTPDTEVNNTKNNSVRPAVAGTVNATALSNASILSDDLLRTPKPAQSTLILTGKPISRITQFFRRTSTGESTVPSPVVGPSLLARPSSSVAQPSAKETANASQAGDNQQVRDDNEDSDINVTSDHEEPILLSRQPTDIPKGSVNNTADDELPPFLRTEPKKTSNNNVIENYFSKIDWVSLKNQTDAMNKTTEKRIEREKEAARERERKKAIVDAKLRHFKQQLDAKAKEKKKKPIDKAYYVDGKLYKQPRLPRPKNWVTDRFYKHLWRCMEPTFGPRTRVKSEKFVKLLSEVVTKVEKRKKYDKYKADVDDLLIIMANLNIIETRYDFYRFCREYMPYSFRIKVVPMMLPGNKRNIPFQPHLVRKRILEEDVVSESGSESKNEKNKNKKKNKNKSGSGTDSDSDSEDRDEGESKNKNKNKDKSKNKSGSKSDSDSVSDSEKE